MRPGPPTPRSSAHAWTAWTAIPSACVHCEKDRILRPLIDQEGQERASAVYRLPSSHSPFLSMSKELATVISSIVDTASRP